MTNNINIESNLTFARQVLEMEKASVAIVKSHNILTLKGEGIAPLLAALKTNKECFEGAAVALPLLDKAAALLLVFGGVGAIFANDISASALDLLIVNKVAFTYITKHKKLLTVCEQDFENEQKIQNISDPIIAYSLLSEVV